MVDQKGDRELVTYAQYVVICTGQYEAGHSPRIKGLENFQGEVMHSKDYKKPNSSFKDKVILCVGCGSSGFDIANGFLFLFSGTDGHLIFFFSELACTVAKKVLLSCKDPSFAPNLTNHPKIQRLPVISHIDFEGKINCGNEFEYYFCFSFFFLQILNFDQGHLCGCHHLLHWLLDAFSLSEQKLWHQIVT